MTLVSVVMAAYQARDTICGTVDSLRAQSYARWELVIASDDGSDYLGFLAEKGRRDPRIGQVLTDSAASGPAAARNKALKVAQGELVTALDADDRWLPHRLEILLGPAQNCGAACDAVAAVSANGQLLHLAFDEATAGQAARTPDAAAKLIMDCGVPLHPLVARAHLGAGWRAELVFAEDVIFNLEVLSRAGNYALVTDSLTHYVARPESLCNRPGAWRTADAAYDQILQALERGDYDLSPDIRRIAERAIREKRALNQAYGRAVAAGQCQSFQEFLTENVGQSD
ncbi:MAG: glycosyltransferase family 2 protein [Pseudomonadota bacterium]